MQSRLGQVRIRSLTLQSKNYWQSCLVCFFKLKQSLIFYNKSTFARSGFALNKDNANQIGSLVAVNRTQFVIVIFVMILLYIFIYV